MKYPSIGILLGLLYIFITPILDFLRHPKSCLRNPHSEGNNFHSEITLRIIYICTGLFDYSEHGKQTDTV